MATLLDRNAAVITNPRGFALFVAATLTILGLIRTFLFPGVGGDDGEQLVFSQFFDWGYQIRNPPLVTWLLIGVQKVTGAGVFSIVALRMVILFTIYLLAVRTGERLFDNPRIARLSAGSLLMVFYMGWNTMHGFTHTSLVTAFYMAALLLVLELRAAPTPAKALALGITLSLGLLAKYSFAVFAFALIAAALFDRDLRRRLRSPWLLIGILIPLPLVVPQFLWLLEHIPKDHLTSADGTYDAVDIAWQKAKSLLRLIPAIIAFFLPFWVIWLAVFWRALRQAPPAPDQARAHLTLLKRLFWLLLALAAVAITVISRDRLRSHYYFVLLPMLPWLFLRIAPAITETQIRRYAAIISLAALTLIGTLVGKYFIEPLVCNQCEDHIPYDDFAAQLREAGFEQGTIFAFFHKDPLAGNLRVRFPDSRVVSAKHPQVVPPRRHSGTQCLIIWPVKGAVEPKSATIRTANESELATKLPYDYPSQVLTANLPPWGKAPHQLEFVLIDEGRGNCR